MSAANIIGNWRGNLWWSANGHTLCHGGEEKQQASRQSPHSEVDEGPHRLSTVFNSPSSAADHKRRAAIMPNTVLLMSSSKQKGPALGRESLFGNSTQCWSAQIFFFTKYRASDAGRSRP
jgi:hypothetical protein